MAADAASTARARRPLDLALFATLPHDVKRTIFFYTPSRPFIREMKEDLSVCMWCQHAFNRQSCDYLAMSSVTIEGRQEGRQEAEDYDAQFTLMTHHTPKLYLCGDCINQPAIINFARVECAAVNASLQSIMAGAFARTYARQHRPVHVWRWLVEEQGINPKALLQVDDAEPCTGVALLERERDIFTTLTRSRSAGLTAWRAWSIWGQPVPGGYCTAGVPCDCVRGQGGGWPAWVRMAITVAAQAPKPPRRRRAKRARAAMETQESAQE